MIGFFGSQQVSCPLRLHLGQSFQHGGDHLLLTADHAGQHHAAIRFALAAEGGADQLIGASPQNSTLLD